MAIGQTIIRRTRAAKMNALAADLALNIAKQRQDPLYIRTKKTKARLKKLKIMIFKKYGKQAMNRARDIANRSSAAPQSKKK